MDRYVFYRGFKISLTHLEVGAQVLRKYGHASSFQLSCAKLTVPQNGDPISGLQMKIIYSLGSL